MDGGFGAALGGLLGLVAGPAIGIATANAVITPQDTAGTAINKLAAAEAGVALLGLLLASFDGPLGPIGAGMMIGAGVTSGIAVGSALGGSRPAPAANPPPAALAAGIPSWWTGRAQYAPQYAYR